MATKLAPKAKTQPNAKAKTKATRNPFQNYPPAFQRKVWKRSRDRPAKTNLRKEAVIRKRVRRKYPKQKQKQKTQTQTKMEKDKADETWYKNATDEDYIEKENGR